MRSVILNELLHFFYPKNCLHCGQNLLQAQGLLCISCQSVLPLTGNYYPRNPTELLLLGRAHIMQAGSLLYFQTGNIAQSLIHALKYKSNTEVADLLGVLMAQYILAAKWPIGNAILVSVPLNPKRLAQRGYNQSALIANAIGKQLQVPTSDAIIYRTRNTETQTKKTRMERLQNVQEAFTITDTEKFQNKHVILIDDVITSGATLESCITAFSNIPNLHISVLCAAIATE